MIGVYNEVPTEDRSYLVPWTLVLLHEDIVKGAIHLRQAAWCEEAVCVEFGSLAPQLCWGRCGSIRGGAVQIKMCELRTIYMTCALPCVDGSWVIFHVGWSSCCCPAWLLDPLLSGHGAITAPVP